MISGIAHGKGNHSDLTGLEKTAKSMMGTTICALSDAAAMPVLGFMKKFPEEFRMHIDQKVSIEVSV